MEGNVHSGNQSDTSVKKSPHKEYTLDELRALAQKNQATVNTGNSTANSKPPQNFGANSAKNEPAEPPASELQPSIVPGQLPGSYQNNSPKVWAFVVTFIFGVLFILYWADRRQK